MKKMCEVLCVSRSGYYEWLNRPECDLTKRRQQLLKRIWGIYLKFRRVYGSSRITAVLHSEGYNVSQKTVARLMKEHDIVAKTVKKYKATTNSKHNLPTSDNLLNQDFTASAPNKKWVSDITYIWTSEGWMYLASIMDLFSRKIVGWHVDTRMTKELVLTALERAAKRQNVKHKAITHHSDRRSQYASKAYQERLKELGMTSSMSRKGNCYDNACIESFHSTIKKELVYLNKFETRAQARKEIFEYIEIFYNRQRIHSSIGYSTSFL